MQRIEWKTWLGADDAMFTGIGAGLVWALKGFVVSNLTRICKVEAMNIEVNPDFRTTRYSTQLYCIFKIRLVHYIYILFWMGSRRKEKDYGGKIAKGE